MLVLKSQLEWLYDHAEEVFSATINGWRCLETGQWILMARTYRLLLDERGIPRKKVGEVEHLFCPGCDPEPILAGYGEPVSEYDLVELEPQE